MSHEEEQMKAPFTPDDGPKTEEQLQQIMQEALEADNGSLPPAYSPAVEERTGTINRGPFGYAPDLFWPAGTPGGTIPVYDFPPDYNETPKMKALRAPLVEGEDVMFTLDGERMVAIYEGKHPTEDRALLVQRNVLGHITWRKSLPYDQIKRVQPHYVMPPPSMDVTPVGKPPGSENIPSVEPVKPREKVVPLREPLHRSERIPPSILVELPPPDSFKLIMSFTHEGTTGYVAQDIPREMFDKAIADRSSALMVVIREMFLEQQRMIDEEERGKHDG